MSWMRRRRHRRDRTQTAALSGTTAAGSRRWLLHPQGAALATHQNLEKKRTQVNWTVRHISCVISYLKPIAILNYTYEELVSGTIKASIKSV
ncbi:hypothetical protein CEXT_439601 [Caerostris extrusa]|uniref:Uncharacterized protein n=1 Tax=Caerostris extrusa TaxID=172846 RepID=A0AAV4T5V7_CAEEX|nr:hypothetical protein CEXT_439601 [Caerostris extrusa]